MLIFIPLLNYLELLLILILCILLVFMDLVSFLFFFHREFKDAIFVESVDIRKMTEIERWVYLRHRTIFGSIFLNLYLKIEIKNAINEGNVVEINNEREKGKIIYGFDDFEDVIILEALDDAKKLSPEEQKNYVNTQILI